MQSFSSYITKMKIYIKRYQSVRNRVCDSWNIKIPVFSQLTTLIFHLLYHSTFFFNQQKQSKLIVTCSHIVFALTIWLEKFLHFIFLSYRTYQLDVPLIPLPLCFWHANNNFIVYFESLPVKVSIKFNIK